MADELELKRLRLEHADVGVDVILLLPFFESIIFYFL